MGLDIDCRLDGNILFQPNVSNITSQRTEVDFHFKSDTTFSRVSIPLEVLMKTVVYFLEKISYRKDSPSQFLINEIIAYRDDERNGRLQELPIWVVEQKPLVLQVKEGVILTIAKGSSGFVEINFDRPISNGSTYLSFELGAFLVFCKACFFWSQSEDSPVNWLDSLMGDDREAPSSEW